MYNFVYITKNLINNKIYIGVHSSNRLNDGYLGSGQLLKKAIKKYGRDNFNREILQFFKNKEDAYNLEMELVDNEFVSRDDTYNLMTGGRAGYKHNENTKKKIKKNTSGKNNYWYGREITEEHRKNLSIAKSGKNHHMYGKKHTDGAKEKISKATSGKNHHMYGRKWDKKLYDIFCKPQPVKRCPYCDITGGYAAMGRWHFDNCKYKKGNEYKLIKAELSEDDILIINEVCKKHDVEYDLVMSKSVKKKESYARQECYKHFKDKGYTQKYISIIMNRSRRAVRFGIQQHLKREIK